MIVIGKRRRTQFPVFRSPSATAEELSFQYSVRHRLPPKNSVSSIPFAIGYRRRFSFVFRFQFTVRHRLPPTNSVSSFPFAIGYRRRFSFVFRFQFSVRHRLPPTVLISFQYSVRHRLPPTNSVSSFPFAIGYRRRFSFVFRFQFSVISFSFYLFTCLRYSHRCNNISRRGVSLCLERSKILKKAGSTKLNKL